ncbi:phosphoserine phosphatase SerB [Consotaella salsifontis]|uniref:Phosphoserine phosphatase n=1 Tax=Consotaella salsifontis TaxID=1365950 RepID=A0A1T4RB78_9HYPH|nr:phosphoserine phosphatase SerB [Consotaella salsifontis]SKA13300.1 phosphoserine phosphatase [Consotaella salsifontis]
MVVVTLISERSRAGLSGSVADKVAHCLGGASPIWLEPEVAADFLPDTEPSDEALAEVRALADASALDCVVQKVEGRRKRILLADMDSTMIGQECIDELAAEIGIKEKVAAITARAMNGEIAFEPALRDRVALLRGLPEAVIAEVIRKRITLAPGGRELVATMRAHGAHTALISGGFTTFTAKIAAMLGFHEDRANRLIVEDGKLAGRVEEPILGRDAKLAALHDIAQKLGGSVEDAVVVGDGANDLAMIQAAGMGVALHAKPAVAAAAPHRIDHGDLTALLFIQGYPRSDFVG